MGQDVVDIGQSVIFKGELSAKQDLTVDGSVEGKIELAQHVLTIGAKGRIKAHVVAKVVIVMGTVDGNITATEKIDIHEKATINGDLVAPRVRIVEGAYFRGGIDMRSSQTPKAPVKDKATEKPPTPPQPTGATHY